MNKFLLSLVFVLSLFTIQAHAQDSREELQSLIHKVDSLEHELAYLKLSYELDRLNSNLSTFAHELHLKYSDIQINVLYQIFNSELANAYNKYYEVCQEKQLSSLSLIESVKEVYILSILTHQFSEDELNSLKARYDLIGYSYDSVCKTMEMLKIATEMYNNVL